MVKYTYLFACLLIFLFFLSAIYPLPHTQVHKRLPLVLLLSRQKKYAIHPTHPAWADFTPSHRWLWNIWDLSFKSPDDSLNAIQKNVFN